MMGPGRHLASLRHWPYVIVSQRLQLLLLVYFTLHACYD